MAATKTNFCHFIQCPKESCCGTLVEEIVGAPQCNECGTYYSVIPMTARQIRRMEKALQVFAVDHIGVGASSDR